MRKIKFWLILPVLLLTLATPALADGPEGDVVIWGKSYTLDSGKEIKGDLLVYGGNVAIETESEVKGDVTVFGGDLTLAGEIYGDVTVWGGNVDIEDSATVRGQVMAVGGVVDRAPGADIRGDEIEGLPFPRPQEPDTSEPPQLPNPPPSVDRGNGLGRKVGNFFRSVFGIMLLMVLGVLVVAFIPRHTETVAETMVKESGKSFVTGLIALIGGSMALMVLAVIGSLLIATLCLAPIGLALFLPVLVAGIALLFGWIAAGLLLGTKVLRAIRHKEPTQVAAVAVGILLLSLVSVIPCIGWALALGVVMWSLGAVVQSRFGTRSWDTVPPAPSRETYPEEMPTDEADPNYDPRMDRL